MEPIVAAEAVLPCRDLDETIAFFVDQLGFRLERISPADDPSTAVLSAAGTRLRLMRGAGGHPGTIILATDGGTARHLVAPNGTRVVLEPSRTTFDLPALAPSFTMSRHDDDGTWVVGRAGMRYRDLIPGRQGGRFIASHIVIPDAGPVPDYVHYHRVRFQMIYCYRGWVRVVYEDQGDPFVMEAGDCVVQPPEIRHRVLESSHDLHVIELTCPAEHDTFAEHAITLPTTSLRPERVFGGQRFHHHRAATADWKPWNVEGFEHHDLGLAGATDDLAHVSVVRGGAAVPLSIECHGAEIRFVFVLAGHGVLHRDGHEPVRVEAGDAVAVPPGEGHGFTGCSAEFEFLDVRIGG
jgi:mannose-6-phosphate isomerase-like protein (cupin superfamily)